MSTAKRTYRDGLFRTLFNDKESLLDLYNGLSGKHYPKDTPIRIVTLEDSMFGDLKNDLAFIIEERLIILTEHQSTLCPNLPLRMLCYIAREYEREYFSEAIYSTKLLKIPAPELYIFYNGVKDAPLQQDLKLSDAFFEKRDKLYVQTIVRFINVNYEKGAELLKACRKMQEYSILIHKIRTHYRECGDLKAAIDLSIQECMDEDILTAFLKKNGGDIVSFLFEELSREECEAIREEDGYVRGLAKGEQRFGNLTQLLLKDRNLDALDRAAKDAAFRQELYEQYNL